MGAILVYLFEPFLFMLALPAIIMQAYDDKQKKELLIDIGITVLIMIGLIILKYAI